MKNIKHSIYYYPFFHLKNKNFPLENYSNTAYFILALCNIFNSNMWIIEYIKRIKSSGHVVSYDNYLKNCSPSTLQYIFKVYIGIFRWCLGYILVVYIESIEGSRNKSSFLNGSAIKNLSPPPHLNASRTFFFFFNT